MCCPFPFLLFYSADIFLCLSHAHLICHSDRPESRASFSRSSKVLYLGREVGNSIAPIAYVDHSALYPLSQLSQPLCAWNRFFTEMESN